MRDKMAKEALRNMGRLLPDVVVDQTRHPGLSQFESWALVRKVCGMIDGTATRTGEPAQRLDLVARQSLGVHTPGHPREARAGSSRLRRATRNTAVATIAVSAGTIPSVTTQVSG